MTSRNQFLGGTHSVWGLCCWCLVPKSLKHVSQNNPAQEDWLWARVSSLEAAASRAPPWRAHPCLAQEDLAASDLNALALGDQGHHNAAPNWLLVTLTSRRLLLNF